MCRCSAAVCPCTAGVCGVTHEGEQRRRRQHHAGQHVNDAVSGGFAGLRFGGGCRQWQGVQVDDEGGRPWPGPADDAPAGRLPRANVVVVVVVEWRQHRFGGLCGHAAAVEGGQGAAKAREAPGPGRVGGRVHFERRQVRRRDVRRDSGRRLRRQRRAVDEHGPEPLHDVGGVCQFRHGLQNAPKTNHEEHHQQLWSMGVGRKGEGG